MIGKLKGNRIKKQVDSSNSGRNKYLAKVEDYRKILFVVEDENESFKKVITKFFPNAHVHHLYLRNIKVDNTVGHNYSVHEADFNLTGKLKNDKLINLSKDQFDLIIDLSENSLLLNYFLHEIPSGLIVGKLYSENNNLHDLFVEGGKSETEFLENITRQINILTGNGN